MNDLRKIRNEEEYEARLKRVDELMNTERTESESAELDRVAGLVEQYEDETDPIEEPPLADAIEYCMDQRGLILSDLAPILGGLQEAEEILAGTRKITESMADQLSDRFNVFIPSNYAFRSATSR